MKKVLLITQYFYPENFKSNDIAFELKKKGYDVEVLTGIPNYPTGKYFSGYGLFKKRIQCIEGVKIYRCFLFPRGNGGAISLALNYVTFAFFASLWGLFLCLFKRYDCVFVHEPSPITQGIPGVVVSKLKRIPFYFWVLDLWPESLESAGGIKNKKVLNFFENVTKFIYNHSTKILISSRGFEKSILEKGDYKDKLVYFPNWGEDVFSSTNDYKIPNVPSGFKVMFAGNIGEAQDFDSLMEAAKYLKHESQIKFILLGDGRKRPFVEDFIAEHGLEDTVHWLGRHPIEAMPSFFAEADTMLVSLKDELIFNLTVPAKIQAYMAASKPIVAMLNGEGAAIIEEAQCGHAVNAGNSKALADLLQRMSRFKQDDLNRMGRNGNEYFNVNFSKSQCLENLCSILNQN